MSPTPNYVVHNLAVAVVVFSLQLFPLHHSPSCFYFHWTTSLFLAPDPSRLLLKLVIRMLQSRCCSPPQLSIYHRRCAWIDRYSARAPFACMLFLSSKVSWISFYILSMFTWSSGFVHDSQLLLTLINHASPWFPPLICTLSAALKLIGYYRILVYIV